MPIELRRSILIVGHHLSTTQQTSIQKLHKSHSQWLYQFQRILWEQSMASCDLTLSWLWYYLINLRMGSCLQASSIKLAKRRRQVIGALITGTIRPRNFTSSNQPICQRTGCVRVTTRQKQMALRGETSSNWSRRRQARQDKRQPSTSRLSRRTMMDQVPRETQPEELRKWIHPSAMSALAKSSQVVKHRLKASLHQTRTAIVWAPDSPWQRLIQSFLQMRRTELQSKAACQNKLLEAQTQSTSLNGIRGM